MNDDTPPPGKGPADGYTAGKLAHAMLQHTTAAIALLDDAGVVLAANPAAVALLTGGDVTAVPSSLVALVEPTERGHLDDDLARCTANPGTPVRGELRCVRDEGGACLLEAVHVRMLDEGVIVGTYRDITDRRVLEEQLAQATKMQAVGQLAVGLAHDSNNLTAAILALSELTLEELPAEHATRDHVVEIKKVAEKAAALNRQLLAVSRRRMLQPVIIQANEVVVGVESMLGRIFAERMDLVTRLDPTLATVRMDRTQLEQVLLNLAINARDATASRIHAVLRIETSNFEVSPEFGRTHGDLAPGPYVLITVSDNGVGMDAHVCARAFEPFFTTKGPDRGTGLGLATVLGIARANRGHIWVTSEVGVGTTFKLLLPAAGEAPASIVPPHAAARPSREETILLVEDEDAVRRAAARFLRRARYDVVEATGPGEALLIAERHPGSIDLLLTDVVMPHMGGGELADRIAAIRPGLRGTVFMSGYSATRTSEYDVLPFDAPFLAKPFDSSELLRKVREALDRAEPPLR